MIVIVGITRISFYSVTEVDERFPSATSVKNVDAFFLLVEILMFGSGVAVNAAPIRK